MSSIEDIKQAVAKLEIDLAALRNAEQDLSNWEHHDLHRRDGSSAQDARHDEIGQTSRADVRDARSQVESQKALIARLLNGIGSKQ